MPRTLARTLVGLALIGALLVPAGRDAVGQDGSEATGADDDRPRARRVVDDDMFEAGGSVDLRAAVEGDLFAAGGWVELDVDVADNLIAAGAMLDAAGEVQGDLIVAGGILDLVAEVGDNLVAAGLVVTVDGPVGRKLFASAARLKLGRDARVLGDAWFAAGSADIGGVIEGDAVIAGGSLTLRGLIEGNVDATGLSLSLEPTAVVTGRLVHHGPEPPDLADGARVAGGIEHTYEPEPSDQAQAEADGSAVPPLLWLLIILVLGLALDVLIPGYMRGAGRLVLGHPFASFGLGVAILFTTPVVIVILMVSVLGLALGLAAIAAYGTLLLLGPAVAVFALADLVLRRAARATITPARRRLAFVIALVAMGLLGWIPYAGAPLLWLVSVLGLGAATWQIYASMRASPPAGAADATA